MAGADPDPACMPRVVGGWLRSPPMPMPMMAGFARIDNPCAAEAIVTGARSDAFASVELHETQLVDGVSRMREVAELPVAAGGEAVLRPGGLHLMLMRPVSPLAAGDVARVEFTLADGRSVGADFKVRVADAR
jgi:copper(I)-binding protein